ncbi:MAG: Hpt domain-containing protein, partial [Myxococcales bacterium]|nr:Hpt domain-containing protein [Myxococcales bacterium]
MSDSGNDLRAQLVGFFFEEATEGIEVIEAGLVELDLDDPDEETINSIFRAMHSIKGASGSFGFTDISNFAHRAETLLDEIRDGSRALNQDVVDLLLKATDGVGAMVQAIQDEVEVDSQVVD